MALYIPKWHCIFQNDVWITDSTPFTGISVTVSDLCLSCFFCVFFFSKVILYSKLGNCDWWLGPWSPSAWLPAFISNLTSFVRLFWLIRGISFEISVVAVLLIYHGCCSRERRCCHSNGAISGAVARLAALWTVFFKVLTPLTWTVLTGRTNGAIVMSAAWSGLFWWPPWSTV